MKPTGKLSSQEMLQMMKPGSIILSQRQKSVYGMASNQSTRKIMMTVFWECEGMILVDVMLRHVRHIVTTDTHIKIVKTFKKGF
jgi:hypothetical protein